MRNILSTHELNSEWIWNAFKGFNTIAGGSFGCGQNATWDLAAEEGLILNFELSRLEMIGDDHWLGDARTKFSDQQSDSILRRHAIQISKLYFENDQK